MYDFRLDVKWILDSGCSYHMCPQRDWFDTYEGVGMVQLWGITFPVELLGGELLKSECMIDL